MAPGVPGTEVGCRIYLVCSGLGDNSCAPAPFFAGTVRGVYKRAEGAEIGVARGAVPAVTSAFRVLLSFYKAKNGLSVPSFGPSALVPFLWGGAGGGIAGTGPIGVPPGVPPVIL